MQSGPRFGSVRKSTVVISLSMLTLWVPSAWSGFAAQITTPVYVEDFRQSGSPPDQPDLGHFVSSLLKLRLASLPSVRIPNSGDQPPCGAEGTSPSQTTPSPEQKGDLGQSVNSYFTIRGTLDFHDTTKGSAAEVLINYELLKTEACQQKVLYQSTETFSVPEAFEKLNSLADDLASRVSEELANRVPIRLYTVTVEGGTKSDAELGVVLTSFLKERLSDEGDLRVQPQTPDPDGAGADYELRGVLRFMNTGNLPSRSVETQFQIITKDKRVYSLPPKRSRLHGSENELTKFLVYTSDSTVMQLNEIRYGRQAGIENIPASDPTALIGKANAALCIGEFEGQSGCLATPKAALAALNKMREQDLGVEGHELIGRADSLIGDASGAAASYEEALAALDVQQTEPRMHLLKDAADAWYDSKNYTKAAGRYAEYFNLVRQNRELVPDLWHSMPESSVRWAHSLTLDGKRLDALESLLGSMKVLGGVEELRGELTNVLDGMSDSDLKQAVTELRENLDDQDPILAVAFSKLADSYYYKQSDRAKAIPLYQTALKIQQHALSPSDIRLASTENSLANVFFDEDRYPDAVTLYNSALAILDTPTSPNEDLLSTVLSNLGNLYAHEGKYLEAVTLTKRALELKQKTLGNDHPLVSQTRLNLAWYSVEAGKLKDAGDLFNFEVTSQKARGVEDERLAEALRGLSGYYSYTGKYFEAEALDASALAIYKKVFAKENSAIAWAYSDAGGIYLNLGKYVDAEKSYGQALEISNRLSGENSFRAAEVHYALGNVYQQEAKYPDAESEYNRAKATVASDVGMDSLYMALILSGWGRLHQLEGDTSDAEANLKQSLDIIQNSLGPDHWRLASRLNDLGEVYRIEGKLQDAELIYDRARSIWDKAGVPDHPQTAGSLNGLALIREAEGKLDEAESMCNRALEIREAALGPQHPDYAESLETLALIKKDRGDSEAALALYRRSLAAYQSTFGPDHPRIAKALESSAVLLRQLGQTSEAQQFEERAKRIRAKYAR
jgi:hypothetical protein